MVYTYQNIVKQKYKRKKHSLFIYMFLYTLFIYMFFQQKFIYLFLHPATALSELASKDASFTEDVENTVSASDSTSHARLPCTWLRM